MCGIAGITTLHGQPLERAAERTVARMLKQMDYRGPDGRGIWVDGDTILGHIRLSIIDLQGGSQPMLSRDGSLCIVFNGEIYNFRELGQQFEKKGIVFQSKSDTEVILAAYQLYGIDCLQYLEGMFAFALWDKVNSRMFCARDHFGKKPFFYTIQNGFFGFASELGALNRLKDSGFDFHVDPEALMRYLAYEYVPVPQTIYREAKSLEPAHYLLLEKGEIQIQRFWDLPVPSSRLEAKEDELARQLESLMDEAVKKRMISDVPLGVFLSGGIDSTIVAGLMTRHSAKPIETFSIGFKEASYDESHYARLAAKFYNTDHHERILSASECADKLPEIVSQMDTPMADASSAPTWLLSALAREHVTVALGGDGSDELWAGYEHYIGYRIAQWYNSAPAWLRKKIIEPLANCLPASAGYINPRLAVKTFLAGAAAPDWLRVQTMLTAIEPQVQKQILDAMWLNEDGRSQFLEIENIFAPTRRHFDHWQKQPAATPLARAFNVYVRQFMLDDILVKVDRCSMLHSLEVRAPFLDKKVAEFVAKLPINYKLHGFRRKYLLKKAFASLLPPEILKRNKRGFQIPVAEWLRGKLKSLLLELINAEYLKKQGVFNAEALNALAQKHFSGEADLRKPLWTILLFQLWWQANKPQF